MFLAVLLTGGCSEPPRPATAPSPGAPSSASAASSSEPGSPSASVGAVDHVFPVVGKASYARTHHDYPASDIIAPCGAKALAATSGTVLEVTRVDTWNAKTDAGATRGGLSVSILGDDGVRYYASHFMSIEPGIDPGSRVAAGQPIAVVGRTGHASACHVHFGLSPACARTGDWWVRRGVIFPWRYLDSWRSGGELSPVDEVTAWQAAHGCPTAPLVNP